MAPPNFSNFSLGNFQLPQVQVPGMYNYDWSTLGGFQIPELGSSQINPGALQSYQQAQQQSPMLAQPADKLATGRFGNGQSQINTKDLAASPAGFDWSLKNPDAWKFGMDLAGFGLNSWLAWKGLGMAQDQFDLQKGMAEDNYANSLQSYNNALRDRIRGRYSRSQKSDAEVAAEAEKYELKGA